MAARLNALWNILLTLDITPCAPLISVVILASGLFAQEKADLYTINRIKHEAFQNSKVMENAFYLTDVYGPRLTRLTGAPGCGGMVYSPFQ